VTPLLSDALAGVSVTRPATSLNVFVSPAVVPGTDRVTLIDSVSPPPTVIEELLSVRVCGSPPVGVAAILKLTRCRPLFVMRSWRESLKPSLNSAKPKEMAVPVGSSST
jgi:hypothetical protein